MAPLPPPATSCRAPSAKPPLGRRESSSAIPNGSAELARRFPPSILSICARREAMAGSGGTFGVDLLARIDGMFYVCSNFCRRESRTAFRRMTHLRRSAFERALARTRPLTARPGMRAILEDRQIVSRRRRHAANETRGWRHVRHRMAQFMIQLPRGGRVGARREGVTPPGPGWRRGGQVCARRRGADRH